MIANEKIEEIKRIIDDEEKANQVLKILQENEMIQKEFHAQQQAKGIAEAKARGVKFGRPPHPFPKNFKNIYEGYQQGLLNLTQSAACLNINRVSFKRMVERYERENP